MSLPKQSQEEGGVIQRVSHLRPHSDESEHVTGFNRKPETYPNCTIFFCRDKVLDTTGRTLVHSFFHTRAGVIMHREGMLHANDDVLNE